MIMSFNINIYICLVYVSLIDMVPALMDQPFDASKHRHSFNLLWNTVPESQALKINRKDGMLLP